MGEKKRRKENEGNIPSEAHILKRFFWPRWLEFKRSYKRKMSEDQVQKLDLKLLRAGQPLDMTSVEFRILQLCLLTSLPLITGIVLWLGGWDLSVMIITVIIMIPVAWFGPHFYLKLKQQKRERKAVRELPDVLDLLTVSLEAGLGFDAALQKIVSKKEGVIPTEFMRCLEEVRLGKTRREALYAVRQRVDADEVKILISSILQAEKLGIGLVQVLRVQSQEVRLQRKQRAEEEAMKAPIKMLFPLVLFIFPSLFIVLLGPALIQLMATFAQP